MSQNKYIVNRINSITDKIGKINMASINEKGFHGIDVGILHPQLQNRWRLQLTPTIPIPDEIQQILKQQILSVKFDYHNQTFRFVVEQNANNTQLHSLVKQLSKFSKLNDYEKINFVVACLDGADNTTSMFIFKSCKLLKHDFTLDYASSESCKHVLEFTYKETQDLT